MEGRGGMVLKRMITLLMCFVLILSTGCWDKIEIDERAFVLALAVDKGGKEDSDSQDSQLQGLIDNKVLEESKIKTIFFMPIPSKLQGGAVDTFSTEESEGSNMSTAIENLSMKFSRHMFFGQTKIILIGENALKDDIILRKLMDFIEKEPDMGREAQIAVVKGSIDKLSDIKPKFEKVFASYMNGIFQSSGRISSQLSLTINEFLSVMRENKGSAVIPVAEVEGDKVSVKKLALIKDYKLLDYVDTKYIRPFSIITNTLKDGRIVIPYKKDSLTLTVSSSDSKTRLESYGDKLRYKKEIRIEVDIEDYFFNEDIFSDKSINEIKNKLRDEVKSELVKTTDYFQNDIGTDYLKIGDYTKKNHYNLYKKYEKNWDEEFKKAKIDYDVQIFIRRLGGSKK